MRVERFMHKEAGSILSRLLDRFPQPQDQTEVETTCRTIAERFVREKIAVTVFEGYEAPSEAKRCRMVEALVEIALASFKHRHAFLSEFHYNHIHGAA